MKQRITLQTEESIKVFMNPTRQKILRTMDIIGLPVTTKSLADKLSCTPSSAKHHLQRLMSIGLIDIDHKELIHGITAIFYKRLPVIVSIGLDQSFLSAERDIVTEHMLMSVYSGFINKVKICREKHIQENESIDDLLTGVVHLTEAKAKEFQQFFLRFIEDNKTVSDSTNPYEYALIFYNTLE